MMGCYGLARSLFVHMKPRSSHSIPNTRSVFRSFQPPQHILTHVLEKFQKGYDLHPGTDQGSWARTRDDACEAPRSALVVPMDQPRQRSRNLSWAASGATGCRRKEKQGCGTMSMTMCTRSQLLTTANCSRGHCTIKRANI
jgi:hypothetical protein